MDKPDKPTIKELFNQNLYSVPDFQRAYVWNHDNVHEFLQDIEVELDETLNTPRDNEPLFLGTLILLKKNQDKYEIVDGQQRITTIIIFIIVLRTLLTDIKSQLTSPGGAIKNTIELLNDMLVFRGTTEELDITLVASKPIKKLIRKMSQTGWTSFDDNLNSDEQGLEKVFNYFKDQLQENTKEKNLEDKANYYIQIVNVLRTTEFIRIVVTKEDHAYDLFERVNARGTSLEVSDLLKNHLHSNKADYTLKDEEGESLDISQVWEKIANNSGSELQRVLRYYFITRNGKTSQKGMYKGLKKHFKEKTSSALEGLYQYSVFHNNFENIMTNDDAIKILNFFEPNETLSYSGDDKRYISESMKALKYLNIKNVLVVIFSFFSGFYKNKLHEKDRYRHELMEFMRMLENFHFINNTIGGELPGKVEIPYQKISYLLFASSNENEFIAAKNDLYSVLKEKCIDKQSFIAKFSILSYEKVGDIKKTKNGLLYYIFDRLNSFDYNEDIPKKLGDSDWKGRFEIGHFTRKNPINIDHWFEKGRDGMDEKHKHNIGNLMLMNWKANQTTLNGKSPKEKYDLCIENDLLGTYHYAQQYFFKKYSFENWSADDVHKHSEEMANLAYDHIWKIK